MLKTIEEENNCGFWHLVVAAAPSILIKFNNYNCNLRPLRALKKLHL